MNDFWVGFGIGVLCTLAGFGYLFVQFLDLWGPIP